MTLRVVADNTVTLPVGNLMDVAGMARRLADQFEAGDFGDIITVVTIVATSGGLNIHGWGENPSGYELMGMFEAAKLQVFAEDAIED